MRHRIASGLGRASGPLVFVLSLVGLVGCEKTPKERLEGRWVGERVDNFPPGQVARAQGWVTGTSFEFQGSRVVVTIPAESPREGTFQLAQAGDDQLLVTFLRPQGMRDQVAFAFDGEDRLRWMLGDGRSIVLRKSSDG
jgi:hypothetical protein